MPSTKLEKFFSYKKTILLISLLITLALGFGLAKLKLDVSLDYSQDNVSVTALERAFVGKENSGLTESVSSATVIIHDNNLFTLQRLKLARQLVIELLNNPNVTSVDSLFNMPDLKYYFSNDDWRPVITGNEKTVDDLEYIKSEAIHNKLFISRFVNEQETTLALYVKFKTLSQKEGFAARNSVQHILDQYKNDFSSVYQVGGLEGNYFGYRSIIHDLKTIAVIGLLVLVLAYSFLFKRIMMGLLPFFSAGLALVWSGGIAGYIGVPINLLVCAVVIIGFCIGAMECAHFINAYQRYHRKYPEFSSARLSAMTTRHVFWPIFFATVTTVLGFFFNLFTGVNVLQDFAIMICLVISLNTFIICFILPLLISSSVNNARGKQVNVDSAPVFNWLATQVVNLNKMIVKKSVLFSVMLILTIIGGIFFAYKLPIEVVSYVNFSKNSSLMKKITDTEKYLSGTRTLSVFFSSPEPEAFKNKAEMDKLLTIENQVAELPETSSTLSIASLTATVYEFLMEGDEEYSGYQVPDAWYFNNTVSNYAAAINSLRGLTAQGESAAKILINYQIYTTKELSNYLQELKSIIKNNLKDSGLSFQIENKESGTMLSVLKVMKAQVVSISIIYLLIFILMWVVFRKFSAGVLVIIPNLFPLGAILLFMYAFNIPLFPITIMVLAVIVGLAVDDTIHIMFAYKKHYLLTDDNEKAVINAVKSQMRPVTIASISLMLGFGVMMFSSAKATMLFSILLCFGAFFAWVSDMVITPFLLRTCNIYSKLKT